MTWTKINAMQRLCGDYVIAKNACTASNMQYALLNRHGKIVKQFERYGEAIKFHKEMKSHAGFDAALEHFNEVFIKPYKLSQEEKNMMINSFTLVYNLKYKLIEKQDKKIDPILNKV